MTRAKRIGYSHAVLATAWVVTMTSTKGNLVNSFLGDTGSMFSTWFFALPFSWLGANFIGFPRFSHMLPEHLILMSFLGIVVVLNGLFIGWCVDLLLGAIGFRSETKTDQDNKKPNKSEMATPRKLSD